MTIRWGLVLSGAVCGVAAASPAVAGEPGRCSTPPMVFRAQHSIAARVAASRPVVQPKSPEPCYDVCYHLDGVQSLETTCRETADSAAQTLEAVGCETRVYPRSGWYAVVYTLDRRRNWQFHDHAEATTSQKSLAKLGFVASLEQPARETENATSPARKNPQPYLDVPVKVASGRRLTVVLPDDSLTAGVPGSGVLTIRELRGWLSDPANHAPLTVLLPTGLDAGPEQVASLDENPLTRAKVELGRQLFFDTRLSGDNTVSCATCHHPNEGFTRRTTVAVGIRGQVGTRNSPVTFNRILSTTQFWDGRAGTLEEQAVGPIENPIEMGNTHAQAVRTLKSIPGYIVQFEAVFGRDGVTIENVGQALAAFERVLVTGPSPHDHAEQLRKLSSGGTSPVAFRSDLISAEVRVALQQAQAHPMSAAAERGRELFFGRARCAQCHSGPNQTDEKFHNVGIGMDLPEPDAGRFAVTARLADYGSFKTPTLRNVALSAPYMHDGSLPTLEDVVEHYNRGGFPNAHLSPRIGPLRLSAAEQGDLVEFLKSCTGRLPRVETARLPAGL
jgi:cytochrome c peroxidase